MKTLRAIPVIMIMLIGCGASNYSMGVSMMQDRIAQADYDTVKTEIMALIDEYPGKPEPYYFLGLIQFNAGKYRECLSNFDQAERRSFAVTSDFLLKKGIALYHTGSLIEAKENIVLSRNLQQSGTAQKYLGLIMYDLGDYAGSAEAFGSASSLSSDPVGLYKYGMALYYNGKNSEALEILLRAAQLSPAGNPAVPARIEESMLFHTANLLLLAGRNDEAVRMYTAIPDGSAYAPESICNSAEAFIAEGKYDTAAKLLANYVKLRPDDNEALLNLSSALIRTGEYVPAADILAKLVKENGFNPDVLYNYGLANLRLGKYAESVRYLAQAAALVPVNTEYRYAYGLALTEYGDIETARAEMSAVTALDPGNTDAAEWLNRHNTAE